MLCEAHRIPDPTRGFQLVRASMFIVALCLSTQGTILAVTPQDDKGLLPSPATDRSPEVGAIRKSLSSGRLMDAQRLTDKMILHKSGSFEEHFWREFVELQRMKSSLVFRFDKHEVPASQDPPAFGKTPWPMLPSRVTPPFSPWTDALLPKFSVLPMAAADGNYRALAFLLFREDNLPGFPILCARYIIGEATHLTSIRLPGPRGEPRLKSGGSRNPAHPCHADGGIVIVQTTRGY